MCAGDVPDFLEGESQYPATFQYPGMIEHAITNSNFLKNFQHLKDYNKCHFVLQIITYKLFIIFQKEISLG